MTHTTSARRAPQAKGVSLQTISVPGFDHVQSKGGIDEYVLKKNGLRVLLKEDHSVPVATLMVTYLVGSVDEVTGITGIAHMLEHMMFKESKHFQRKDKRDINELLDKKGARLNASTWRDRTNYHETVATEFLEDAIALEADRMRNALLKQQELDPEMVVVRNEFEIKHNDPLQILYADMAATAYQAHPYHHDTIGWLSDIKEYTAEKLQRFYDTYYYPNNAIVSVIGDIDVKKTLALIRTHFGMHAASPHIIPRVTMEEPEQEGQRRIVIRRPGTFNMFGMVVKKPAALHADIPALIVLAGILGDGNASLLHRALVDAGLASDVEVEAHPFRYPSSFGIYTSIVPGVAHETIEKVVVDVCEHIKTEGVSQKDVDRAKNRLAASAAFERTGTASISDGLCEAIATGDWTFYVDLPKRIAKVSVKDVTRVARTYLVEKQSTVGYYYGEA
ncbi:MAG: insulinase family protein [Candidatus Yonathbacteria bacterium]|nr:insulinase family protein [Candidatus Yonathbacteria bacterium]